MSTLESLVEHVDSLIEQAWELRDPTMRGEILTAPKAIGERWWEYRPIITVVDVLETGACFKGVTSFILGHNSIISALAAKYALEPHARDASRADGFGDGSPYGDSGWADHAMSTRDGSGWGDGCYGGPDGDGCGGDGYSGANADDHFNSNTIGHGAMWGSATGDGAGAGQGGYGHLGNDGTGWE